MMTNLTYIMKYHCYLRDTMIYKIEGKLNDQWVEFEVFKEDNHPKVAFMKYKKDIFEVESSEELKLYIEEERKIKNDLEKNLHTYIKSIKQLKLRFLF